MMGLLLDALLAVESPTSDSAVSLPMFDAFLQAHRRCEMIDGSSKVSLDELFVSGATTRIGDHPPIGFADITEADTAGRRYPVRIARAPVRW